MCGTYNDLVEERSKVIEAIQLLQHQLDSMEYFGARSNVPLETCLEEVRKSNVLVVIIGHRYGNLAPGMDISFSEAEYHEGFRLRKPCLVYIKDENQPILPAHIERDPEKQNLLDKWKQTLREQHTIASFTSAHDISLKVTADLSRTAQALENTMPQKQKVMNEKTVATEVEQIISQAVNDGLSETVILSTIHQAMNDLRKSRSASFPLIFFNFSHTDKIIVREIADRLYKQGIKVWVDLEEVKVGENWRRAIYEAHSTAEFLVVFISTQFLNSRWGSQEIDALISLRLSDSRSPLIIPVLLDNSEIPAILKDFSYIDLRKGDIDRCVTQLRNAFFHRVLHFGPGK